MIGHNAKLSKIKLLMINTWREAKIQLSSSCIGLTSRSWSKTPCFCAKFHRLISKGLRFVPSLMSACAESRRNRPRASLACLERSCCWKCVCVCVCVCVNDISLKSSSTVHTNKNWTSMNAILIQKALILLCHFQMFFVLTYFIRSGKALHVVKNLLQYSVKETRHFIH